MELLILNIVFLTNGYMASLRRSSTSRTWKRDSVIVKAVISPFWCSCIGFFVAQSFVILYIYMIHYWILWMCALAFLNTFLLITIIKVFQEEIWILPYLTILELFPWCCRVLKFFVSLHSILLSFLVQITTVARYWCVLIFMFEMFALVASSCERHLFCEPYRVVYWQYLTIYYRVQNLLRFLVHRVHLKFFWSTVSSSILLCSFCLEAF